jgi:hypothetical protein
MSSANHAGYLDAEAQKWAKQSCKENPLEIQGEHAKDDNIAARCTEAIAEVTALLSQIDSEPLKVLETAITQELWDRQQVIDLAQFELTLPW